MVVLLFFFWGGGSTLHRLVHRLSSSACVYKDSAWLWNPLKETPVTVKENFSLREGVILKSRLSVLRCQSFDYWLLRIFHECLAHHKNEWACFCKVWHMHAHTHMKPKNHLAISQTWGLNSETNFLASQAHYVQQFHVICSWCDGTDPSPFIRLSSAFSPLILHAPPTPPPPPTQE